MNKEHAIAYRNDKGNIQINSLNLQIALDDIFELAKTEKELNFIEDTLAQHVEGAREEASGYLQEQPPC